MTFSDLTTRVSSNVIDLPSSVQANVPVYVNRAIRSAERKYNFRYMEKSALFVTTTLLTSLINQDGSSNSTILNFKELLGRGPYVLQQNAAARGLYLAPEDREVLQAFTLNTSYPDAPVWVQLSGVDPNNTITVKVYPYPDLNSDWNDGNYRIVIPYTGYSTPLSSGSDFNWMTNNAEEYIEEQASGFAFQADHDYNGMALWFQRADAHFQEIKLADKKARLAGIDTLIPQFEGANFGQVQR